MGNEEINKNSNVAPATDTSTETKPTDKGQVDTRTETDIAKDTVESKTEQSGGSVPLAKYMDLKRELREHKQRLMEKEEREKRDDLKKKLAGSKLDDDTKTLLAEVLGDFATASGKENLLKSEDESLDEELTVLAKDEYYADASVYKTSIKETMDKFKVTPKQAYNLIRSPEARFRELSLKKEQEQAAARANGDTIADVPNTINRAGTGDPKGLSAEQRRLYNEMKSRGYNVTEDEFLKYDSPRQ